MVEFPITVNKQQTAYVPKVVTEQLGRDLALTPDTRAALVYPRGATLAQILASLHHLQDHFQTLAESGEEHDTKETR